MNGEGMKRFLKHTDLLAAVAVVMVVTMLVVPLPAPVLDLLITLNILRVLQSLLSEGVPIRDLGTIVEAIGDKARTTRDTSLLSEYARQALGRAITAPHLDEQLRLQAITLDPAIEQEVSTSVTQTTDGEYLAMEPSRARAIVSALRAQVEHASARTSATHGAKGPVLLCSARVRRHLRRLIAQAEPRPPRRLLLQRDRAGDQR
jgi:flagellar biosynthesis protein FlhA